MYECIIANTVEAWVSEGPAVDGLEISGGEETVDNVKVEVIL